MDRMQRIFRAIRSVLVSRRTAENGADPRGECKASQIIRHSDGEPEPTDGPAAITGPSG